MIVKPKAEGWICYPYAIPMPKVEKPEGKLVMRMPPFVDSTRHPGPVFPRYNLWQYFK
jgi:hypothetical protein